MATKIAFGPFVLDVDRGALGCARDMSRVEKLPGDVLAVLRAKNPDWTAQIQDALRKASE